MDIWKQMVAQQMKTGDITDNSQAYRLELKQKCVEHCLIWYEYVVLYIVKVSAP